MSQLKLRDYQRECIDAVFCAWAEGVRRPAVVLPTGAGKTVVFSHLIRQWRGAAESTGEWDSAALREAHGARVMVLAHRDELVDQAINKIRAALPADVSVGKVKAGDNELTADVLVCSVQTLASQRRREQVQYSQVSHGDVGLIITDECHHAAAVLYGKVYEAFPDALQLGVTATMARGDRVGLGSVWEDVVYTRSILWMISKGYLCDVRTRRVEVDGLDMAGMKTTGGDYSAGALGEALEETGYAELIAKAYGVHAADRQGIVFTPTVATAEHVTETMSGAGFRTEMVSGETPREERRRIYEDFRTGRVQVLASCMVLTEGFDAPWAEVAVVARPTQSEPLYTQMVGRVLRTWPGKKDALVLDVVGASSHKLRTLVDLTEQAVPDIRDGESLAEAVLREDEAAKAPARPGSVAFDMRARDVDMFTASDVAWNRTTGGILYIECGPAEGTKQQRRVFLWPADEPGLWDVCGQMDGRAPGKFEPYTGMDLSSAMAWGEVVAEDRGAFSVQRSARWRKNPPSEAQTAYAEGVGIDTTGMSRGDVSDALSARAATRALDGMLG
jgi:superfamily II DNA or RNA helicase